jgi:hypothetical protein
MLASMGGKKEPYVYQTSASEKARNHERRLEHGTYEH